MGTVTFQRRTEVSIDELRGDSLPQKIKLLVNGDELAFRLKRTVNALDAEAALISKARYDALIAGAITPAPESHMLRRTDDFCIPNLTDLIDIVLGREQAEGNLQVQQIGSGAKAETTPVTVPATPFEIDLMKRILLADSDGAAGGVASFNTVTGVVTFDAGEEGNSLNLFTTSDDFAVIGIEETVNDGTVSAILLSAAHYDLLVSLQ